MRKLIRNPSFLVSFFIGAALLACQSNNKPAEVSIEWLNGRATGLNIPHSLIKGDIDLPTLKVELVRPDEHTSVLGTFEVATGNDVVFTPLVPLTRGLKYDILLDDKSIAQIIIPVSNAPAPELLAIYPSRDTVPENLLKMYLHFNQSMIEGRSLSYVTLLNGSGDTLKGTFLDLQPELWNDDGTVLTLWLDPGRVKRDLIPNKELGIPLKKGEMYSLLVSPKWKSKNGIAMTAPYNKRFFVTLRDEKSPDVSAWSIRIPAANTKDALEVDLHESLDYSLLMDIVTIVDVHGTPIDGITQLSASESILKFIPALPWKADEYAIRVQGILEDLAGNNLNRLFDRDLKSEKATKKEQEVFEKKFTIGG